MAVRQMSKEDRELKEQFELENAQGRWEQNQKDLDTMTAHNADDLAEIARLKMRVEQQKEVSTALTNALNDNRQRLQAAEAEVVKFRVKWLEEEKVRRAAEAECERLRFDYSQLELVQEHDEKWCKHYLAEAAALRARVEELELTISGKTFSCAGCAKLERVREVQEYLRQCAGDEGQQAIVIQEDPQTAEYFKGWKDCAEQYEKDLAAALAGGG